MEVGVKPLFLVSKRLGYGVSRRMPRKMQGARYDIGLVSLVLHNVYLAACRPFVRSVVGAQQPECRPDTRTVRQHQTRFKASVFLFKQSFRLNSGGRIRYPLIVVLQCGYLQASQVVVSCIRSVLYSVGVVLQFLVAVSRSARFVHPFRRIGFTVFGRRIKFIRPGKYPFRTLDDFLILFAATQQQ